MHPVMNPNEANEQRELSFTPPQKPNTQKRIPVNDAVLKLGCFSINKINIPKENMEINFLLFLIRFQWAKRLEASRIRKGLINSDGCTRKFPSTSHREDPLTVIPAILVRNIRKNKIKKIILEATNLYAHRNLIKNDKKLITILSFSLLIL